MLALHVCYLSILKWQMLSCSLVVLTLTLQFCVPFDRVSLGWLYILIAMLFTVAYLAVVNQTGGSPQGCLKFAFVHIPKTGGSTIMDMIGHEPLLRSLRLTFTGMSSRAHNPAAEQRARLTPTTWESAFTFSVVRDPYEYAISQFFYHLAVHCDPVIEGDTKRHAGVLPCKYAKALATIQSHTDPVYRFAFKEWLSWLAGPGHFNAGAIAMVRSKEHYRNSTIVTQKAWLTDVNNGYIVKHVVKLDSEEYNQVATCQGLAQRLCSDRTSVLCTERKNASKVASVVRSTEPGTRDQYYDASNVANVIRSTEHGTRDQYYDAESCEIVAKWFAEDFSAFEYNSSACPFPW